MKNKICLIIDSSEAFLRSKTEEIFIEWGFTRPNVKSLTTWEKVPKTPSLFGDLIMTHLDLTKTNDRKAFVSLISGTKTKKLFEDDWFGNGLIITVSNSQGSKKIEKLVTDNSGFIIKKEKAVNRKDEMFKQLDLNNEVKQAVSDYVGEDYDLMLSFTKVVSKFPNEKQKKLTIEEAFSYFPPTPGAVPPWDYLNALIRGNTLNSIDLFRRTVKNTHVLVCLVFITKKMQLLYRVKVCMSEGLTTDRQISENAGETSGWELKNIMTLARKVSLPNAERIAMITSKLESDIKGGSHVDPHLLFERAILEIGRLLN